MSNQDHDEEDEDGDEDDGGGEEVREKRGRGEVEEQEEIQTTVLLNLMFVQQPKQKKKFQQLHHDTFCRDGGRFESISPRRISRMSTSSSTYDKIMQTFV